MSTEDRRNIWDNEDTMKEEKRMRTYNGRVYESKEDVFSEIKKSLSNYKEPYEAMSPGTGLDFNDSNVREYIMAGKLDNKRDLAFALNQYPMDIESTRNYLGRALYKLDDSLEHRDALRKSMGIEDSQIDTPLLKTVSNIDLVEAYKDKIEITREASSVDMLETDDKYEIDLLSKELDSRGIDVESMSVSELQNYRDNGDTMEKGEKLPLENDKEAVWNFREDGYTKGELIRAYQDIQDSGDHESDDPARRYYAEEFEGQITGALKAERVNVEKMTPKDRRSYWDEDDDKKIEKNDPVDRQVMQRERTTAEDNGYRTFSVEGKQPGKEYNFYYAEGKWNEVDDSDRTEKKMFQAMREIDVSRWKAEDVLKKASEKTQVLAETLAYGNKKALDKGAAVSKEYLARNGVTEPEILPKGLQQPKAGKALNLDNGIGL